MSGTHYFRAVARHAVSFPATLAVGDGDWDAEVQVVDLGLGGAGLVVRAEVAQGAPVQIHLAAPNLWDPLVLEGRVAWCLPRDDMGQVRMGVGFNHSSPASVRVLADLLTGLPLP